MVSIRVERLDHLGVIAAVIKDLGLDSYDQRSSRARCTRSHHTRRSRGWDDPQWPWVCQPTVVLDPTVFC